MNRDQFKGQWKQVRGRIQEKWGRLRKNDLDVIRGRRDQLVGRVQEVYGLARDKAKRQVAEFERGLDADRAPARRVRVRVNVVRRTQRTSARR